MRSNQRELWVAFAAILLITLLYLFTVLFWGEAPAASGFLGHMLGVIGFLLMLMTETLYTWRKRSRSARWGRMSEWLQFHIFTGLVGPYLVLLHTSWKFNGLAGVVLLLTLIVVASGFVGRYIYTAVPRTPEGVELSGGELTLRVEDGRKSIEAWLGAAELSAHQHLAGRVMTGELRGLRLKWTLASLPLEIRRPMATLAVLVSQQRSLQRQIASLAWARRLLGIWHTIHIPIGMALFTAAFIHIAAAIYYATLLK